VQRWSRCLRSWYFRCRDIGKFVNSSWIGLRTFLPCSLFRGQVTAVAKTVAAASLKLATLWKVQPSQMHDTAGRLEIPALIFTKCRRRIKAKNFICFVALH
jgi:hypothetical protein